MFYAYAGRCKGIKSHCDIRGTCKAAYNLYFAVIICKRQSEKQTGKVLRRYIARQNVFAATKLTPAAYRQLIGCKARKRDAMLGKHIGQRSHRTLRKLSRTDECRIGTKDCRYRNEKTECRTALSAVECAAFYHLDRIDVEHTRRIGYGRTQSVKTAHCGNYIVIYTAAYDSAWLFSKSCTNKETVRP